MKKSRKRLAAYSECVDVPLRIRADIAEVLKAEDSLRYLLLRLTEKVERANGIRHSGGRLVADDWSELYQLTNEARGVLAK